MSSASKVPRIEKEKSTDTLILEESTKFIKASAIIPAAFIDIEDTSSGCTTPIPGAGEEVIETEKKQYIFKDPNFVHSTKGAAGNKRTRVWKNLKQINAAEKTLKWQPDDVTYASIDAPPSFTPAKKYSDVSGQPTLYTDPQTKLRYLTAEEFSQIRVFTPDISQGYLALRKAKSKID